MVSYKPEKKLGIILLKFDRKVDKYVENIYIVEYSNIKINFTCMDMN